MTIFNKPHLQNFQFSFWHFTLKYEWTAIYDYGWGKPLYRKDCNRNNKKRNLEETEQRGKKKQNLKTIIKIFKRIIVSMKQYKDTITQNEF